MPSDSDLFVGVTGESHPEVYERLPRSNPLKEGQLTDEQLQSYYKDGFLLVEDFFKPEELDPLQESIKELVDGLADKLFDAGKIKCKYENLDFTKRLSMLEKDYPGANILFIKQDIFPESFTKIGAHPRMLNLLEDFLGPDIAFNPIWNLRAKTPDNIATVVPWHQDAGYTDANSYKMHVMTAWVPLVDANKKNGTLELVRGSHASGRVAKHSCCAGPTWYVMLEEEEIEKDLGCNMARDSIILNVPRGSFILFNNFIVHRSLENKSDDIRWSIDFRWQKSSCPDTFFGLKEPLPVRMGKDPSFKPDWTRFNSVKRNDAQMAFMEMDDPEFSTVISGPWMKKWSIVHENRHTNAFFDDQTK